MADAVEGVTLEQYARAAVAIHAAPEEEWDAVGQEHGIPPGRIRAIGEEWNRRFAETPGLVQEYSRLYQQAMRDAGITAPDISLEQYVEILRSQQRGEPMPEALARFGLTLQTFAMVSQTWIERMAADTSIAIRFAELLGHGQQQPPAEQPPIQPLL